MCCLQTRDVPLEIYSLSKKGEGRGEEGRGDEGMRGGERRGGEEVREKKTMDIPKLN